MIEGDMGYSWLVERARGVLGNSYAPYSGIHVAAAIVTAGGRVYLGVNVENSSYGLTICAERSAVSAMVTGGDRDPVAIAIVSDTEEPIPPCGACRQVLAEFNPDMVVVMHSVRSGKTYAARLSELFPSPFRLRRVG